LHIWPKVKVEKKEVVVKKESTEKKKVAKPIFTVDIPTMICTMHCPGSEKSEAKLEAGPDGFLVAKFSNGLVHETELCNLMLLAALPKKIKKKPAAAEAPPPPSPSPEEPAEVDAHAPPPEEGGGMGGHEQPADDSSKPDKDYGLMYYWKKGENTLAIRAKFGSKGTVLSFGGSWQTKSKEEMMAIGKILVKDLKEGKSAAECKVKGNQLCRE